MMPDRDVIEAALLRLIGERAPGKTLDPTEAARALGGPHPDGWGPLMQPIRRVAVALAEQGRAVILRKGKAVDPHDFKDRKSTRLNSSHRCISYAVFCLKKKKNKLQKTTE